MEEFSSMRTQYIRSGEGFIIVYSVIEPIGFKELMKFSYQIYDIKGNARCPIIFVGKIL